MKAALLTRFGTPEALTYTDVDTPAPRTGEVLVRVRAAGVNRIDHYLREGMMADIPLPHVLGSDAAGEVAALGAGVDGFAVGDPVIPVPGYPMAAGEAAVEPFTLSPSYALLGAGAWGTYAEYVRVPARYLVEDATGLPPEQVATLPMVAVTGVRAVKEVGGVRAGQKVVVLGGSSGTGGFHVQLARALGAEVLSTTTSDAKADYIRALGAGEVVNTREPGAFEAAVAEWTDGAGADVVIDNLGGDFLQRSVNVARPGGTVVAMGFVDAPTVGLDIRTLFFPQKRILGSLMGTTDDLTFALALAAAGKIVPQVDRVLPLSEAAHAHELLMAGGVRGNLVLVP